MRLKTFIFTIFIAFALTALVMNKSINTLIEQKYHITLFNVENPLLKTLSLPRIWLDNLRAYIFPSQEDLALEESLQSQTKIEPEPEIPEFTEKLEEEIYYPLIDENGTIILEPHSTFLLIGDSMMQGVGMTLVRELQKRDFNVINLAKQSTGLTYPHFFDWQQSLKDAFAKNPNINVVVMMVGANDPYNMPKIKFQSPEWVEIYTQRIQDIIQTTLSHKAIIIWYQVPFVKKEPLNQKLIFLNTLYKENVESAKQVFLDSNAILSPDNAYTAYIKAPNGKSIRLRNSDGIHFSTEGSKLLSQILLDRLEVLQEPHELQEQTQEQENQAKSQVQSTKPAKPINTRNRESNMESSTESNVESNPESNSAPDSVESLDSADSTNSLDYLDSHAMPNTKSTESSDTHNTQESNNSHDSRDFIYQDFNTESARDKSQSTSQDKNIDRDKDSALFQHLYKQD